MTLPAGINLHYRPYIRPCPSMVDFMPKRSLSCWAVSTIIVFLLLLGSSLLAVTSNQYFRIYTTWYGKIADPPPAPPWHISEKVWAIVAAWEPRPENQCPVSTCSATVAANTGGDGGVSDASGPNNSTTSAACPDYFRWIHEDLQPWKGGKNKKKITRVLLDRAAKGVEYGASFRVVVKKGRLYVEPYGNCFQTRAIFSLWGMMQLLKFHRGRVPDLELVFGCGDKPAVSKKDFPLHDHDDVDDDGLLPPPVFRYCTTAQHLDIPFPDWSFWGWPEISIQPWEVERQGIEEGARRTAWKRRRPTAFWKGNVFMGDGVRMDLLKCHGHGAEILGQDWHKETKANFRHSKLANQCNHRYKVYVEGIGWSVSLKYILACNSPVLLVEPVYKEFFARGLIPGDHYWPIKRSNLCHAIRYAIEWSNNHTSEAQRMGEKGSNFMKRELDMNHVYDYMLHLLREYASLLDFEPSPSNISIELCEDAFTCVARPSERPLFEASMVHQPSPTPPCALAPRDEAFLQSSQLHFQSVIQKIHLAEDSYWSSTPQVSKDRNMSSL